ncbi:MAG: hypothetical protein OEY77_14765 [Nitrospira sp.]|nr:hypothetical protein [Nitrospira sp.]
MWGDVKSYFTTTLVGVALALLSPVMAMKMTPFLGNGLLVVAWLILIISFYRTPYVYKQMPIAACLLGLGFASAVGLALYFTLWTKIENAPLELSAHSESSEHPGGVAVDGILWSAKFTDLRIDIINPTKFDYQNIDLLIIPDAAITAATQVTKLQGVSVWRVDHAEIATEVGNTQTGERVNLPYVSIATTFGYRVRCELLPSETHIQLLLAGVTVQGFGNIDSVNHVLKVDFSNGSKIWLAHKDHTDKVFGPRPTFHAVKVTGRYTAQQRDYEVLEELEVIDYLHGALDKLKAHRN